MIVDNINVFDGKFLKEKFIFNIFGYSRTLAIGNIVSFLGGLDYREKDNFLKAEHCINFCIELPRYDSLSGVLFNRLFLTNVAQILSTNYLNVPIEVSQNKLIVNKDHEHRGIIQKNGIVSVNLLSQINDTFIIYLGLYNKCGEEAEPRAFSMNLSKDDCEKLMNEINESFYFLSNDVFLNTCYVK